MPELAKDLQVAHWVTMLAKLDLHVRMMLFLNCEGFSKTFPTHCCKLKFLQTWSLDGKIVIHCRSNRQALAHEPFTFEVPMHKPTMSVLLQHLMNKHSRLARIHVAGHIT